MKKILILISAALFLQGCTYAISRDLAKQADKSISFEALERDPESVSRQARHPRRSH